MCTKQDELFEPLSRLRHLRFLDDRYEVALVFR